MLVVVLDSIEYVLFKDSRIPADSAPTVAPDKLADGSTKFNVRPWARSEDCRRGAHRSCVINTELRSIPDACVFPILGRKYMSVMLLSQTR